MVTAIKIPTYQQQLHSNLVGFYYDITLLLLDEPMQMCNKSTDCVEKRMHTENKIQNCRLD